MQEVQDDGSTLRDHIQRLVKVGRLEPEELHGPEMPMELEYMWEWFGELSRTRRAGPLGAQPLSYPDIDAWARLTDRRPKAYEVEGLLRLDAEWRNPRDPDEED